MQITRNTDHIKKKFNGISLTSEVFVTVSERFRTVLEQIFVYKTVVYQV